MNYTAHVQTGVSRNVENGTHVIFEHQNWWSSEASCAFCCASPLGVLNSLPFPTRGNQQANHWLTTGIAAFPYLPFMLLLILIFWSGNTGAGDGTTTSLWRAIQVSPGPCTTGTVGWLGCQFAFIGTIWIILHLFGISQYFHADMLRSLNFNIHTLLLVTAAMWYYVSMIQSWCIVPTSSQWSILMAMCSWITTHPRYHEDMA